MSIYLHKSKVCSTGGKMLLLALFAFVWGYFCDVVALNVYIYMSARICLYVCISLHSLSNIASTAVLWMKSFDTLTHDTIKLNFALVKYNKSWVIFRCCFFFCFFLCLLILLNFFRLHQFFYWLSLEVCNYLFVAMFVQ